MLSLIYQMSLENMLKQILALFKWDTGLICDWSILRGVYIGIFFVKLSWQKYLGPYAARVLINFTTLGNMTQSYTIGVWAQIEPDVFLPHHSRWPRQKVTFCWGIFHKEFSKNNLTNMFTKIVSFKWVTVLICDWSTLWGVYIGKVFLLNCHDKSTLALYSNTPN